MKHTSVDAYVAAQPAWQVEIISALREVVRAAAPQASETIKWAQPVYEDNGPFAWIKAYKGHVNLGFWRGSELADPRGLLQGDGDRMRHIKLTGKADIKKGIVRAWVKEAVRLNRLKGNPTMARNR